MLVQQVSILLNEKNMSKSDKDTKLDVLNILANVAGGEARLYVLLLCHASNVLVLSPSRHCRGGERGTDCLGRYI